MEAVHTRDDRYQAAAQQFGPALARLAAAYEADPDKRRDLAQDVHFQIWRSFQHYDARCSLRTWVYRIAHHVAASHVLRERRVFSALVSLEDLERLPDPTHEHQAAHRRIAWERLLALIHRLKPLDRQVMLSYLEDMDAASIAEITGLSSSNVATRIHRIKNLLARQFQDKAARHAE